MEGSNEAIASFPSSLNVKTLVSSFRTLIMVYYFLACQSMHWKPLYSVCLPYGW